MNNKEKEYIGKLIDASTYFLPDEELETIYKYFRDKHKIRELETR